MRVPVLPTLYNPSWHLTAGRSEASFHFMKTVHSNSRSPPPAVADLVLVKRRTLRYPTMRPGGIFETVLYAEDLAAAERFYRDAVGLQVIGRGDLAVVFRCGDGVLLIFDPRQSRAAGRAVPSHGAASAGHIAFTSKPEDLGAWRKQLHEAGVSIEQEKDGE